MEKKENTEIIEEKKELDFAELENRLDELDSTAFINADSPQQRWVFRLRRFAS